MPLLSTGRSHIAARWLRRLLFAISFALLGYVGFILLDAKMFQAYENWRLHNAAKALSLPSGAPSSVLAASASSAVVPPRAQPAPGATLGRLELTRLGLSVIVVEGTDENSLRRAAGHIVGSSLPGGNGNVAIAGHRDTFFRALRNIRQGDEIRLMTLEGTYRYRVDSTKVVAPDDMQVLNDSAGSTLTLVTCYPFYFVGSAPKRFIVRAHQD